MWVALVPGRGNSDVSVAVWAPRVPGGGDGEPYGEWWPAVVRLGTALGRGMNNHATYNQQLYGFFILPNLEIPPPGAWLHCCLLTNINIHHQYLVKWILICSTFSPQLEFKFFVGPCHMCNVMILFVQHRQLMAEDEADGWSGNLLENVRALYKVSLWSALLSVVAKWWHRLFKNRLDKLK